MSQTKEEETKTVNVQDIDQLKDFINAKETKANKAIREYRSLVLSAFGPFPKTEIQLVEFIQKVMELSK